MLACARPMRVTVPRQILPGSTYLVTRRCTQRLFLLRPSEETNRIVRYCLALAARDTRVILHAVVFMSDHWHGVVTDPHAALPEFLERFHRLLARALNALLGREENFWSSDKPSVVVLPGYADVVDKIAYVIANPVSAGLVEHPNEWPGVVASFASDERRIVEMPDIFFDRRGQLPRQLGLEFLRPTVYPELSDRELGAIVETSVERLVSRAQQHLRELGRTALGPARISQESTTASAKSVEHHGSLSPRVAGKSRSRRIQSLAMLAEFVRKYRDAWSQWRVGVRDVVFPAGSYALRVHAGVRCAPA